MNFSQKQEFTLSLIQAGTTPIFQLDVSKEDTDDGLDLKESVKFHKKKSCYIKVRIKANFT